MQSISYHLLYTDICMEHDEQIMTAGGFRFYAAMAGCYTQHTSEIWDEHAAANFCDGMHLYKSRYKCHE